MSRRWKVATAALGTTVAFAMLGAPAEAAHHRHRHRPHARTQAAPYASGVDGTPTCRTADGTPYDPDIIGGLNHVGDGGPAVNLGTGLGNPCSAFYLGGPGLVGPR